VFCSDTFITVNVKPYTFDKGRCYLFLQGAIIVDPHKKFAIYNVTFEIVPVLYAI
jgi:hypothetical protein